MTTGKMQRLIIPGTLPGLNELIQKNRTSFVVGAKLKREADRTVCRAVTACRIRPVSCADFVFRWYCPNKKRDKDNIAAARKFIFDGLVKSRVLKNDGWQEIGNWRDEWFIDKQHPRVEVEIWAM